MVFSRNQKAERKESKAGMIRKLGLSVGWKLFFSVRNVDQVSLLSHCERTLACCVVFAGEKMFSSIKKLCLFIYCAGACIFFSYSMTWVWRSEDNSQELILSFVTWVMWGIKLRSPGLAASTSSCCAGSLTLLL